VSGLGKYGIIKKYASPPDGGEGAERSEVGEVATHGTTEYKNPPPHPALSAPKGGEGL